MVVEEEEPNADKPLVGVSDEIDISRNGQTPFGIKYYNADPNELQMARVEIDDCKPTDGVTPIISSNVAPNEYPVIVVSVDENVQSGTYKKMPFVVTNNKLLSGQRYICKLIVYGTYADGTATEVAAYTHNFFVNVRS